MELLIPGLILVGLMIYVSTRIKRSAASAYEREVVETDEFSITKPDGFIVIENEVPHVIFGAYSQEYGADESDSVRQVSAELRAFAHRSIAEIRASIVENSIELVDEQHLADGTVILETQSESNGVAIENEFKLVERNGTVYELRVAALSETKHDNQKKIDEMLASFELK